MNRIKKIQTEAEIKTTGMLTGMAVFIINVAFFMALQKTNSAVPEIAKISILLSIGGLILLKFRPRW